MSGAPRLVAAVSHAESSRLGQASVDASAVPGIDTATGGDRLAIPTITASLPGDAACSVIIDASTDDGAQAATRAAIEHSAALLVATTGLSAPTRQRIEQAAATIPVLIAPNTSLGIAVTRRLVHRATRLLGPGYDAGLVEAHHRHKKDAPSGTAFVLREAVEAGGGSLSDENIVSLRGGDVVGEHTVRFAGAGEYLEIRHVATSRSLFARGAVDAACWLAEQPAGRYSIDDLLAMRLSVRDESAS